MIKKTLKNIRQILVEAQNYMRKENVEKKKRQKYSNFPQLTSISQI